MLSKQQVKDFEKHINYVFKNKDFLVSAMTHSSYANEHNLRKVDNNERLEFLGDAVLEIITSDYLFKKYPDLLEGELTKFRASIVCEPTLASFSREIQLGTYVLLGKGEDLSGGRNRDSVLSDSVEALIGAIYLDGGFDAVKKFVFESLLTNLEARKRFVDSKTHLQEWIQRNSEQALEYVVISETGPDHNKRFVVEVRHEDKVIGQGTGKSKKSAEQHAAYDALIALEAIDQENKVFNKE